MVGVHDSDSFRVPTSVRLLCHCMPEEVFRQPLRNPFRGTPETYRFQPRKPSSACGWCLRRSCMPISFCTSSCCHTDFCISFGPFAYNLSCKYHITMQAGTSHVWLLSRHRSRVKLGIYAFLSRKMFYACVALSIYRNLVSPTSVWPFGDCTYARHFSINCLIYTWYLAYQHYCTFSLHQGRSAGHRRFQITSHWRCIFPSWRFFFISSSL